MKQLDNVWFVASVYAGLLLLAVWCGWTCLSSAAAAQTAAVQLTDCHRLASAITDLSSAPLQAQRQTNAPFVELRLDLQAVTQSLGIRDEDVLRVDQQAARRVGDSAYLVEPAQIELRNVTLGQLVGLMLQLLEERPGLSVQSIRLSAPRSEVTPEGNETWSAEVVLTHLIYSPKSPRP